MTIRFSETMAEKLLKETYNEAALLLNNPEKVSAFLALLKNKHPQTEFFVSLVEDYTKGIYKDVSFECIQAVTGALIYVMTSADLVPDTDEEIGYVDDISVMYVCRKMYEEPLEKYKNWKERGK